MLRRRDAYSIAIFLGFLLYLHPWYNNYVTRLMGRYHSQHFKLFVNSSAHAQTQQNKSFIQNATRNMQAKPTRLETKRNPVLEIVKENKTSKPNIIKFPKLTAKEAQEMYYGKGCKMNRYRKRLQTLLHEWKKIVKRRHITHYFICFGSFLGSVRNGDIVPYDSDVDICMFHHEYYKLYPEESRRPLNLNDGKIHMLLQTHSPHPKSDTPRRDCKGNVVRKHTDNCAILDPHARLYNGAYMYMDIFMIDDLGRKLWDEYRDTIHLRGTILPIQPCTFLGLDTYCPNNPDRYLTAYYGKDYLKPHHICKGGKWKQNMPGARKRLI